MRLHRRQPTRPPQPWDSPDKNAGVGCHFLLQCMKVKSESEVAQSCPTLSDPMDCSPPGSSVHGIFQARVLEWGAIAFSISKVYFSKFYLHIFVNMNLLIELSMAILILSLRSTSSYLCPWIRLGHSGTELFLNLQDCHYCCPHLALVLSLYQQEYQLSPPHARNCSFLYGPCSKCHVAKEHSCHHHSSGC